MDTRGLSAAIKDLVPLGKRTIEEQCVTSMGWILVNAQKNTRFTQLSTIDSELQVITSPAVLKSGKLSTNKRRQREVVTTTPRSGAEMIVVARMHPAGISKTTGKPNYNALTGSQWALSKPDTRGVSDFWKWVASKAQTMIKMRHSSTHFLQHGFASAIKACFSSPLFQHSKKYRSVTIPSESGTIKNHPEKLGRLEITQSQDSIVVVAENNIGEGSNEVLDAKRRAALIVIAGPPTQAAIYAEEANCNAEIIRRWSAGAEKIQKMLH